VQNYFLPSLHKLMLTMGHWLGSGMNNLNKELRYRRYRRFWLARPMGASTGFEPLLKARNSSPAQTVFRIKPGSILERTWIDPVLSFARACDESSILLVLGTTGHIKASCALRDIAVIRHSMAANPVCKRAHRTRHSVEGRKKPIARTQSREIDTAMHYCGLTFLAFATDLL
jgi:hypothetical protein